MKTGINEIYSCCSEYQDKQNREDKRVLSVTEVLKSFHLK